MLWEHEPLASVQQHFLVLLNFYWTIQYFAKVMQTPVDEIRKNSSFSTNSWPKRNFHDISANFRGMYCFERLELSATCSLMESRKKIKILHKQGLHPTEILKALKREGLPVSFSSTTCIIRMLYLTFMFHGKLTSIRKTSKAVYGSEHRMWEQCKISIGKICQDSHKNRATLPKYLLLQPSLINIQCFVAKCKVFHTLCFTHFYWRLIM